ncbi:MAG: glucosaminidase domain-containing protein, partial [Acidimicrobiales bacterium]
GSGRAATSPAVTGAGPASTASPSATNPGAASPPAGRRATGTGNPGSQGPRPARAGAKTGNHKPAPIFVEPPAAVAALVQALTADELQLRSLDAYSDARSYLRAAQARRVVDAHALSQALSAWEAAKAKQREAEAREAAAYKAVALYEEAICEVGVAEYTGQALQGGTDLQAAESQLNEAQLGTVATDDASTALSHAEANLAIARADVRADRALSGADKAHWELAERRLSVARGQVVASRRALVVARRWATTSGEAPARPAEALAGLEGSLAGGHRLSEVTGPAGSRVLRETAMKAAPAGSPEAPRPAAGAKSAQAGGAKVPAGPLAGVKAPGPGTAKALGPTVMGPPFLSAAQVEAWFASTGAQPGTTVPMGKLVADYMEAGRATGVRADLAFAQSVVETGYFSFPSYGQDPAHYNNFAGIGACDSCKSGWKFPTAMDGVMAQLDLLSEYAQPPLPRHGAEAPTFSTGVQGCCRTWTALSGVWATNPNYGFEILAIYRQMLDWTVQSALRAARLPSAAGSGPMSAAAAQAG